MKSNSTTKPTAEITPNPKNADRPLVLRVRDVKTAVSYAELSYTRIAIDDFMEGNITPADPKNPLGKGGANGKR